MKRSPFRHKASELIELPTFAHSPRAKCASCGWWTEFSVRFSSHSEFEPICPSCEVSLSNALYRPRYPWQ